MNFIKKKPAVLIPRGKYSPGDIVLIYSRANNHIIARLIVHIRSSDIWQVEEIYPCPGMREGFFSRRIVEVLHDRECYPSP